MTKLAILELKQPADSVALLYGWLIVDWDTASQGKYVLVAPAVTVG